MIELGCVVDLALQVPVLSCLRVKMDGQHIAYCSAFILKMLVSHWTRKAKKPGKTIDFLKIHLIS